MAVSSGRRADPGNVVALGLVSFLTDISSEVTLTFLPLFLKEVLGTASFLIGVIEGLAESTVALLKFVSGWLSDRLGRRKMLTLLGYGLSAFSKPFLYLAGSWGAVLVLRFVDRVGKGIRTAPRDALVADSAAEGGHGRTFGLHRALDTAGAVWGTGIIAIIVYLSQQMGAALDRSTYQRLVLWGILPGFLALLILALFVREVRPAASSGFEYGRNRAAPLLSLRGFDRRFYIFLAALVLFTLGNSSDAFLLLRARTLGLTTLQVALMVVAFNVVYSLLSMPAGSLSDRVGRRRVILIGWTAYGLIYLGFALAGNGLQMGLLYVLYGLYYAAFEGTSRALVADIVPDSARRGTAYGVYHVVVGITAFPASALAGLLWDLFSPAAAFYFGAGMAILAAVLFGLGVRFHQER